MANTAQNRKLDFIMREDARGIFQFKQHGGFSEWSGGSSGLRDLLLKTVRPGCQYTFVSTAANPKAVDLLLREDEKPEHREKHKSFYFDQGLMQTYLLALARAAQEQGINDVSYPMVEHHCTGDNPHHEAASWHVMHVIPSQQDDQFIALAGGLNIIGYKHMLSIENPQNYRVPQIDFLRDRHVMPLVAKKHYTYDCDTLVNIVNMLCRFEYSKKEPSDSED